MLTAKVQDTHLMLVNVYAPTQKQYREKFFHTLNSELSKHYKSDHELILGGDWNCVLNVKNDVQGTKNKYYKRPTNLKKIMNKYALYDVWRFMHPDIKQFTWRNVSLKRASRLDFWLVTKNIKRKTTYTDIRPAIRADHNAISLKFCTKHNERGPGYWKINTDILNDKDYQNGIVKLIDSFSSNCLPLQMKWEMFKVQVREFSQKYCRKKALEKKDSKLSLEAELNKLEKLIDVNASNDQIMNSYIDVKEKLEKIYKHESRGAGIRARTRWMEKGEKSTKYFLNLEKSNVKKKEITQLKCDDN